MLGKFILTINNYGLFQFIGRYCKTCPTRKQPWITFSFLVPTFRLPFYKKDVISCDWYRELGLRCSTHFLIHESEGFWSLNMAVFGFGVYLSFQYGY